MDVTKETIIVGTAVPTAIANPMPEFHTGLCSCPSDMGICCQTMFCWLCTNTNLMNAVDTGNPAFSCGTCCLIMCCCCNLELWMLAGLRRIVIQRYGIRGEGNCVSCVLANCCCCCNSCQMQREMGERGQHNLGMCASPKTPQMMQGAPAVAGAVGQPPASSTALWPPMKPHSQWSSGFCSCGCLECIEIMCCPCFITGYVSGKLQSMLDGTESSFDPFSCVGAWICKNQHACNDFMARREVIERYNIRGESVCNTCCYVQCCCAPCLIAQARREMGFRGEFPGGLLMKEHPGTTYSPSM